MDRPFVEVLVQSPQQKTCLKDNVVKRRGDTEYAEHIFPSVGLRNHLLQNLFPGSQRIWARPVTGMAIYFRVPSSFESIMGVASNTTSVGRELSTREVLTLLQEYYDLPVEEISEEESTIYDGFKGSLEGWEEDFQELYCLGRSDPEFFAFEESGLQYPDCENADLLGRWSSGRQIRMSSTHTHMHKTHIEEMLCVMSEMTKSACEGVNFTEISTYVRNHIPGIEPEFVEVFRDMITPIVSKHQTGMYGLRYNEETGEFEN